MNYRNAHMRCYRRSGLQKLALISFLGLNAFQAHSACLALMHLCPILSEVQNKPYVIESFIHPIHPVTVVSAVLEQNAVNLWSTGDKKAVAQMRYATVMLNQAVYGCESLNLCGPLLILGCSYVEIKNYREAERVINRSIKIAESHHALYGNMHHQRGLVESLEALASVYRSEHRYQNAATAELKVVKLLTAKYGNETSCGMAYRNLAEIYQAQNDYDKAAVYFKKALILHEPVFGPDDFDSVWLREQLAQCAKAQIHKNKA